MDGEYLETRTVSQTAVKGVHRYATGAGVGRVQGWRRMLQHLPRALIVKESIRPHLVILGNLLGLFVTLEPCLILLMESPTLTLESLCSQILLICSLAIVEGIEKCICLNSLIQPRVIKNG